MEKVFKTVQDNPKDLIKIEIGDSKQVEWFPQLKVMRWDNEVNISLRLIQDENMSCEFRELTEIEGGYAFDVILKEQPKSNKIEFTLNDKDLAYHYQPPLTEEWKLGKDNKLSRFNIVKITETDVIDIDGRTVYHRPENVVGSYAIYSATPKKNYTNGKEYKTGKIGHLYRPKITDAKGNEVWGTLNIEKGILTITIPQDFLDKAVYPVTVDPDLGYTSVGAGGGLTDGVCFTCQATSDGTGGTTSVIKYYVSSSDTTSTVHLGIYDGSGNYPVNLLTPAVAHNYNGESAVWISENYVATIAANTKYWLASSYTPNGNNCYLNSDTSSDPYQYYGAVFNTDLPDPFPGGGWNGASFISIYAVYASGGGGGTNIKINIGDVFKDVTAIKLNVGDVWKDVTHAQVNIGDTWKTIF